LNIFNFSHYKQAFNLGFNRHFVAISCVIITALIFVAAHKTLTSVFYHPSPQFSAVSQVNERVKGVFLGSSQFQLGIDHSLIPVNSISLTLGYIDYQLMEQIWEIHAPRLTGVEFVVIEWSTGSVLIDRLKTENLPEQELIDMGFFKHQSLRKKLLEPSRFIRHLFRPLLMWRFSPYTLHQRRIEEQQTKAYPLNGFVPLHRQADPKKVPNQVKQIWDWHLGRSDASITNANFASLNRLLDHLAQQGIKVILVKMPAHPAVIELPPGPWQEASAKLREFFSQKESHMNLTLIDTTKDSNLFGVNFSDANHLNAQGAALFTSGLVDEYLYKLTP